MNWYVLEPKMKYGINEILNFVNEELQIRLKIDTNWKHGSLLVNLVDNTDVDCETKDDLYSYFDEITVDMFTSGTEEFTFIDMKTNTEIEKTEEHNKMIEKYIDDGVNFLFEQDYVEEDPEIYITGGFTLLDGHDPYGI